MKAFLWVLMATILCTFPAWAQDDDFGFGGGGGNDDFFDIDSLGDFGSGGGRAAPQVDPLADVRVWLARSNAAAMDEKQEKDLKKLYEKEVKAMEKSFKKQFGVDLQDALATVQAPARGRRGASVRTPTTPYGLEIRRLSDQLVDKVIAGLRIDQQAALRRYQSEQLRASRYNILVTSMAAAGAPLNPEQLVEVEALFTRESRLRTLMIVESKGESHQLKVAALETQTTQRVVDLLDEAQKLILAESLSRLRVAR